jgi:hypothetical protein
MIDFFYRVPAIILLPLAILAAVALACAGQNFVHRRFRGEDFVRHNEVGGIIITVSGAIYAVILGFLTIEAWDHQMEARQLTMQEANADIDAWYSAVGLPPALRQKVRADMLDYAMFMLQSEWPLMKEGRFDPQPGFIALDALAATGTFVAANSTESNAQNATFGQLITLHDARQRRIMVNQGGVSWFEWVVLLIGAVCIICFCWFFGAANSRTHLLMTATVVTMIASVLVLLFELQHPFRSDVGIGSDVWDGAIAHVHAMQTGDQMNMR